VLDRNIGQSQTSLRHCMEDLQTSLESHKTDWIFDSTTATHGQEEELLHKGTINIKIY